MSVAMGLECERVRLDIVGEQAESGLIRRTRGGEEGKERNCFSVFWGGVFAIFNSREKLSPVSKAS